MKKENELIKKHYYKQLIMNKETNPISILAEAMLDETQKEEGGNECFIRFAQGEVYYHHKDYESAIFKWEKVENEFVPWAKKNIADSYYELGYLVKAEEEYLAIHTDNVTLASEVQLQLFSLYMEQSQLEQAAEVIKQVVALNPDYLTVTEIARTFFEEHRDWDSAIELAIQEAIRTESMDWFNIVSDYIDKGLTKAIEPNYFTKLLQTLFLVDIEKFEKISVAFWKSYQHGEYYFSWLTEFNQLLSEMSFQDISLQELSKVYEETYSDLISEGTYLIEDISSIVSTILTNWLKITKKSQALLPATAVLSWNQIISEGIEGSVVKEAEAIWAHASKTPTDGFLPSIDVFNSIVKWANEHGIQIGERVPWMVEHVMDLEMNHVMIAGEHTEGKSQLLRNVLGQEDINEAKTILYRYGSDSMYSEILESGDWLPLDDDWIEQSLSRKLVAHSVPSSFLKNNNLEILTTKSIDEMETYVNIADRILYVIDINTLSFESDLLLLEKIQRNDPTIAIDFIVTKMNTIYTEQEVERIVTQLEERIKDSFPLSQMFDLKDGLHVCLKQLSKNKERTGERNQKILKISKRAIELLLEKRVKREKQLLEEITWNEEAILKLTGANNQLSDIEKEKIQHIKESYEVIMKEMKDELKVRIPKTLQACSRFVNESSNFKQIHIELNRKMNEEIQQYLQQTFVPKFANSLQQWLEIGNVEFIQSQAYLKDMTDGFNRLYQNDHFKFQGDFRILDDWYRDIDRMNYGVHVENMNILLRVTPSQLLLKSSGKLFGVLPSNKSMVEKMYKKFIENEDYKQVTDSIISQYMLQFDLFGKALERDMKMFFSSPFRQLNEAIIEAESAINHYTEELNILRANPKKYNDPLTLFKTRIYQLELVAQASGNNWSESYVTQ
ncbi:GTP-binding protein [Alkalihalobacillus sp. MEB130]|uniref:GTP-binding protein n=1 Tax=Alkalihalobacillus sp. MEB130 TaxID=2976704 RepID=UPI0028DF0F34|nr:GTP-binding protein [Alkalihalobacillus sp. MEB130]MDT8859762.1 GTP-binding protein [Alkalihalobacillus sp. MEB130]